MMPKKIVIQYTLLTFIIAIFASSIVIALGQFGYSVSSTLQETIQNPWINIPFVLYILSPAIASYLVLKKNHHVTGFREWLKTVFYVKNSIFSYMFIIGILAIYFLIHIVVSNSTPIMLPFYMFFLNLPGNLFIGGLEEAGWMYILQPALIKKYGYFLSSIFVGSIWFVWHIPLFFIPGVVHSSGLINIAMFAIQLISFRFIYGAIYKITHKGHVFMSVLLHTMFNASSSVIVILPETWKGTILANATVIIISIVTVILWNKFSRSSQKNGSYA